MSENAKTIGFVLAGLLAITIGMFSAPSSSEVDEVTLVGTDLTAKFKDPDTAKRLKIVRFNEDTATLADFEVAEQNGLWSIPSKDGYPADAAKQMAEAATSLMDREILGVASKNAGDHEQYGVIEPDPTKLEPGQKGVGTRVTMSDAQNKPLVDLILGKAVRNAETQRYVREVGRDVVYVVEIDPAKLSTNFEDWIEKDLLKLNAWDLQQVEVKDYSAEMGLVMGPNGRPQIGVAWDPRADLTFTYSDSDAKWTPAKLRQFDSKQKPNGEYVDFTLAEDEELNPDTLNALKSALDDLKIVDVKRKPQGLSENLKAGESFMNNREALQDLITKGFAATASQPGQAGAQQELISSDGEVVATMKNGVEYVLRFGNLTNVAGQDKEGKDTKDAKDETKAATPGSEAQQKDKDQKNDVHRYLFVMARFNESAVKQPEIVKLPDLPATPGEAKKDDAAGEAKTDAAAAPKDGEAKDQPEEKKEDAAKPADDSEKKTDEAEKKSDEAEKKPGESASADDAAKKDNAAKPADEAKKQDDAKKEGEASSELEKVIAERKQIEQENQRKLDEYQASLKKGQEAVKELNVRFGDWYFVVDDNVFQKVRVGKDKVIKKKEKKADEAAATPGAATPPAGIPGLPVIPGAAPAESK